MEEAQASICEVTLKSDPGWTSQVYTAWSTTKGTWQGAEGAATERLLSYFSGEVDRLRWKRVQTLRD